MDYSELIAEVAHRLDAPGFPMRAAQLVKHAETELNQAFQPFEYEDLQPLEPGITNWLLIGHEEIYIAAIMKQYFLMSMNPEGTAAANTYLQSLIGAKKHSERTAKANKSTYVIGGCTP